MNLVILNIQGE